MKNEQIVQYSPDEEKFKAEGLLYMDLDSDVRTELFDLFSNLSNYKKYAVLSKTTPVLCGLLAILVTFGFVILFLSVGFTQASRVPGTQPPIMTPEGDVIPNSDAKNAPAPESTAKGDDESRAEASGDQNPSDAQPPETATQEDNQGKADNAPEETPGNNEAQTDANNPNATSDATDAADSADTESSPAADQSSPPQERRRLLQAQNEGAPEEPNNAGEPPAGEQPTTNPKKRGGFPNEIKASLGITILILFVIAFLFVFFECKKRRLLLELQNYEFNAINLFLSKHDKKIAIYTEHTRRRVLGFFKCFNVYIFVFLVKKLDVNEENAALNGRAAYEHRTNSFATLENESSINETLEAEGEKYQTAIVSLNKKLDRMNIKG